MTSAAQTPPRCVLSTGSEPVRQAEEEACGEEVTGAGGVDDPFGRGGRHVLRPVCGEHDSTLRSARHDHEQAGLLGGLEGGPVRPGVEEHRHLLLVAEQDVDVVEQQVEELASVPSHAEGVRQRQCDRSVIAWAVAAAWRSASLAAGTSHR